MASNQIQSLLHCIGCHKELNLESKTLPCLHSFCRSCLESNFEGQADGNGQCQECHEHLTTLDQLSLSPFLVKSLRHQQLESTDWKCDLCFEDGIESIAINWCHDCKKLFCINCGRCHKKLQRKHNTRNLDEMERGDAIKLMTTDMCYLHQKSIDLYCEQCNVCFCDTCYQNHSTDSAECCSNPVFVGEEALKQKLQGPTLAKEMDDLEISLRRLNERTRNYTEELNSDCNSKCKQLWLNFEEMRENAKQKTEELCVEMRQITTEQVTMWCHLLEENEKILKQLEIWRLNLHHLLGESPQDVDVVCGLRMLGSKLLSEQTKSVRPEEKCELRITFPNWWLQFLNQLKTENIGSVSWTGGTFPAAKDLVELPAAKDLVELPAAKDLVELPAAKDLVELPAAKDLVIDKQWSVNRLNLHISCIYISPEDNHIFLGDKTDKSIIVFTEGGEFDSECLLFSGDEKFTPIDICSISRNIIVVCCWEKFIFLERRKIRPSLKIQKFFAKDKNICSLCQINGTIFACDDYFQMYSFTKEGTNIIRSRISRAKDYPRIRANPMTRNFWMTRNYSEIFSFTSYGEKILSMKIEKIILDFCVDEFGHLYFCNEEGIFSFSPENLLFKFEKKPEDCPKIFVLKNKVFVSLRIDGKWLIKIFKIPD